MTNQEIFDRALQGIRTQGTFSRDVTSACLYRGPNGTKCAVGHLIPDEIYDPAMDVPSMNNGSGIDQVMRSFPKVRALFDSGQDTLLAWLQDAHDCAWDIDLWEIRMSQIAENYGLTYEEKSHGA